MAPARAVPAETLGHLAVGVEPSGVVLGRDSAGRAVLVRLFGHAPISAVLVGGWWAARLLLFRCLAHGAVVTVRAREPHDPARPGSMADAAQWLALGATGGPVALASQAGDPPPAGPSRPLLRVHDMGPELPAPRPPGPWQTGLTVLPQLTPAALPLLAVADVLLVQRLPEPDAALLGAALGARADLVARLPAMDSEMVAALGAGSVRYAWLTPTPTERHFFG